MNDQPQQEGRGRFWLAIGTVVAATVAAVLMVPDEKPDRREAIPAPPAPPVEAPAPVEVPVPAPAPPPAAGVAEPAPAPSAPAGPAPPAGPEGSAARAWLASAGNPSPEEVAEQAERFREEGRVADAWLLFFKAARDGSAGAAMALAEQADPAFFDPARSALEKPDLVQAHKWYRRAQELGAPQAPARLEGLLQRLQKRAAAGDERAAVLLQEWRSR